MRKLNYKPVLAKLGALFLLALVAPHGTQAESLPLFGPEKFIRETGAPDISTRTFPACNTGAIWRLVVVNGAENKDRLSSATVTLNGVDVIRPNDLNQRVERIEKEVTLHGENTLAVRLAGSPGGLLTVSLVCASGCLDVTMTAPAPDSTVNRARTLVQGSLINASGETGVVLTSVGSAGESNNLAQVQGDRFAGLVPLQTGENTLTATATDACGYRVSKTIVVQTDTTQESVRVSAWPDSGVLPTGDAALEVTLEATTNLPHPTANYAWDFDGNGTPEQSGNDLAKVVAQYAAPGLYLPVVTVTDTLGNSYQETAAVLVLSQEEMNTLLQGKWTDMQNALVNGDINAALRNFDGGQESKYKRALEKLKDKFAEIFTADERLDFVSAYGNRIEYENIVVEGDKAFSYPIVFVRDENGLWKIRQF